MRIQILILGFKGLKPCHCLIWKLNIFVFFSYIHHDFLIFLAMYPRVPHRLIALKVSGKLPTYPSHKRPFCSKWEVSINVSLWEGAISQKPTLIRCLYSQLRYCPYWRIWNCFLGWAHLGNGPLRPTRHLGFATETQSRTNHHFDHPLHVSVALVYIGECKVRCQKAQSWIQDLKKTCMFS